MTRTKLQILLALIGLALGAGSVVAQNDPAKPDASADEGLKKFDEMPVPTVEELLTRPPVDWIVLRPPQKDLVLVVQPVSPRPDTVARLAKMASELKTLAGRPKQDQGESADQYRERILQLRDEAENLLILLPDRKEKVVAPKEETPANPNDPPKPKAEVVDVNEYKLNIARNIDRIVYHEDLMLRRADMLMNEGQLSQAFELLLVLERRYSDWPGYTDRRNRLIYEEAKQQAQAGNSEASFAYFEELHTVAPTYPGLRQEMGAACNILIEGAEKNGELMRARFYLSRLRKRDPENPVSVRWTDVFVKRVDALLDRAKTAREQGQHQAALALVEDATRTWPSHPLLKTVHRTYATRYQVLNVGVVRFPGDANPYQLASTDDRRQESLLTVDLFEVNKIERNPQYQSRFIEEWTPTDLGRQIVFSLRPRRLAWEASPVLSATQVVQSIGERLQPNSPDYDERLANYVRSLSVRSANEFVVNLSTTPARPQAIFRFPVRTREAASSATAGATAAMPGSVLSQRFKVAEQTEDRVTFRRSIAEPETSTQFHVAEVVEQRYASHENAVQGLLRGDISLYPNPPIWLVSRIAAADNFQVEPYSIPTTHVLQFNAQSEPLKNNEFRRAIAYAINRERILKEVLFRNESSVTQRSRLTSAPFATRSYAYNQTVEPHKFDPQLAFALVTVSKKRLGGEVPELTMICEPDEMMLRCASEFVKEWARVGVKVNLISDPKEPTPAKWDIVYRTVRMQEPITDLWPFLTMRHDARVRDLEHLPDWLRQQLVELEQAPDLAGGIEMLRRLHLRLQEFVQVAPLWEIDDVVVIRKNIQFFQPTPLGPYHNIEKWVVQPWFPGDSLGE